MEVPPPKKVVKKVVKKIAGKSATQPKIPIPQHISGDKDDMKPNVGTWEANQMGCESVASHPMVDMELPASLAGKMGEHAIQENVTSGDLNPEITNLTMGKIDFTTDASISSAYVVNASKSIHQDAEPATTVKKKKIVRKVVKKVKRQQFHEKSISEGKQDIGNEGKQVNTDVERTKVQAIADNYKASSESKAPNVVKRVVVKAKGSVGQRLAKQGGGVSRGKSNEGASKKSSQSTTKEKNGEGSSKESVEAIKEKKEPLKGKRIEAFEGMNLVETHVKEGKEMYGDDKLNEELGFCDEALEYQGMEDEEGAEDEETFQVDEQEQKLMSERQKRKRLEVFVGGLDKDATESDLRDAFKQAGEIVEIRLMMNSQTGKNKGYAFIRFATPEQADRAANEFSKIWIRGKESGVQHNKINDALFIGNIARDWKHSEVLQKLKEYGVENIEELNLVRDYHNEGLNRGFAFLELASHYDALHAFQCLQQPGVRFGYDRPAKVSWALPFDAPDGKIVSQVRSVFVDGMPSYWNDDKVRHHFGRFGEIERTVFARNMHTAKRRDFAFVNFVSRDSALKCVEAFKEVELNDEGQKVTIRVTLARPTAKRRFDYWSGQVENHFGHMGVQGGRGEAWFPGTRPGFRRGGRGFSMRGRGGKRLYDEDEVLDLLRRFKEEEDWSSRGRRASGPRMQPFFRDTGRGAYGSDNDKRPYDEFREDDSSWTDVNPRFARQRPFFDRHGSEGEKFRAWEDHGSPDLYQSHRGRGSFARSRYEDFGDHVNVYEGEYEAEEFGDAKVGMKRPVSEWDEDAHYYEADHRGYPRARVDYVEAVHHPPGKAPNYTDPARSERIGLPVTREEPVSSLYTSGSGLSLGYNTVLPETSAYASLEALEASKIKGGPMYASFLYGGNLAAVGYSVSAAYDVQPHGYY